MSKGKQSNIKKSTAMGKIVNIMVKYTKSWPMAKKVNKMVKGKGIIRMQFPPVHHTPPLLGVLQENCATQRLQANLQEC